MASGDGFIQTLKLKSGEYAKFEGYNVTVDPITVRIRKFVYEAGAIALSDAIDEISPADISIG